MATMNISLPDAMKAWVEAKAEGGQYANSSDYVRDLIRRDQMREERIANLRRLIREADESEDSDMSVMEIFEEALAEFEAKKNAA